MITKVTGGALSVIALSASIATATAPQAAAASAIDWVHCEGQGIRSCLGVQRVSGGDVIVHGRITDRAGGFDYSVWLQRVGGVTPYDRTTAGDYDGRRDYRDQGKTRRIDCRGSQIAVTFKASWTKKHQNDVKSSLVMPLRTVRC